MTRTLLITGLLLFMATLLWADVPNTISFQGRLTDQTTGNPVDDGAYDLTFTFYDATSTALWTEPQAGVQVTGGLYHVLLGTVAFFGSLRFDQQLYLGIQVGSDPELTPRYQMASAPSALAIGEQPQLNLIPQLTSPIPGSGIIFFDATDNFLKYYNGTEWIAMTTGPTGATGPQGPAGEVGPAGATGLQGPSGSNGIDGGVGATGPIGFSGQQGVIIPSRNRHNLMLREDVVESVRQSRFHIYSADSVDEAMELLTGLAAGQRQPDGAFPEGSVNARVDARLRELGEAMRKFGRPPAKPEADGERNENDRPQDSEEQMKEQDRNGAERNQPLQ